MENLAKRLHETIEQGAFIATDGYFGGKWKNLYIFIGNGKNYVYVVSVFGELIAIQTEWFDDEWRIVHVNIEDGESGPGCNAKRRVQFGDVQMMSYYRMDALLAPKPFYNGLYKISSSEVLDDMNKEGEMK